MPAPARGPAPPVPAGERPDITVESEIVLKWVGVVLVVLAVGFAVSTAISRGWIGAELQLVGAVGLSVALIVAGFRLRTRRPPWAHALTSGGVAALYTTFASNLFVDQTSTDTAFVMVAVVVAVGYAVSHIVPSEWVGVVTLVGGLTAWFVVGDGDPPFATTLALVAFAAAVAVGLSLERGWCGLRLLGHAAALAFLLGLAFDADMGGRQVALLAASAVVFLSLARVPSFGTDGDPWMQLDIQLAAAAGPWAIAVLAATFEIEDEVDAGLVALAVALATGGIAGALGPRIRRVHQVSLLIGVSVSVTIGLATLLGNDGFFIAIAVQAAGLLELDRHFGGSLRIRLNAVALLGVAAAYVFVDGIESWTTDVAAAVDIVHGAVIVVLAVAVWRTGQEALRQLGGAALLGLVLIWLGSVLVHLPEGQAAVSVSWAIVGVALLVAGSLRKMPDVGGAGLAVLALTVGKLLIVDMQEVDALWRAGLFLLVGLGLMRLGFLLPRLTGVEPEPEAASSVSA